MNIDVLLSLINQYVTLDEEETAFLESLVAPRRCRRNEIIAQSGKSSRYMVLVISGYVSTYYTDNDGVDHVVQFAGSSWWTGDQNSPAIYSTRALSDGEVILLSKATQDVLMEKHIKFERYFRHVFQHALMRMQERFTQSHSSAEERYLKFRARYGAMEQHVPQKSIASYLGITPEFLSKIRKRLVKS
jgi:CRP-like cAMP-binding protein